MPRIDRFLNALLVIAAVAIAAVIIRREVLDSKAPELTPLSVGQSLTFEPDWISALEAGVVDGERAAPIQLIQFADLECPACREFEARVVESAREQFQAEMAVTYVHFPLPRHRFAKLAATAAECAGHQARFQPFVQGVYAKQDSIGLKPWAGYALDAGVPDTSLFGSCLREQATPSRVEAGLALGERLEIRGTPTVLVNGWRFSRPPTAGELTRTIDELRAGREPSLSRVESGR